LNRAVISRRREVVLAGLGAASIGSTVAGVQLAMTDPDQGDNRRGAIAGLAIAVFLLVFGLWLARELTASSKMQDCLMSGRTNCNVIEPAR
jgi:hypothetical protein